MKPTSDWRDRAQALQNAMLDLGLADQPQVGSAGTPDHRALFKEYVPQLREAKECAEGWWRTLVETEQTRTRDPDHAAELVRERHPSGTAGHKFVIGVVRIYWLKCAALNERLPRSQRVSPAELLLGWLVQKGPEDLAEFLAGLPYWPLGLSEDGRWV